MNFHPLLVHFPLTLFTLYALFELVPVKKITQQHYWFYVKAIIVLLGVLAAVPAILAGLAIENQFTNKQVVNLHKTINLTATAVFAVIAFGYLSGWLRRENILSDSSSNLGWKIVLAIEKFVVETPMRFFLALVGLVLISLGGALGGIIVYGPDLDPVTHFVYTLLIH